MFVILIVIGIFLLWLGIALRKIQRGLSILITAFAVLILLLAVGAFFGLV